MAAPTSNPNRILENNGLSLGARMAYSMLLKYAWQKDFCFPAQERIATDLGVSDRSVRTFLKELRAGGLIDWKQQGLNRPNIYYILRLPDRAPQDGGPEEFSGPDRKQASGQERKQASDKEHSRKNTQHTRVHGVAIPRGEVRDAARELVHHFHETAGHPASQKPLAKELSQAAGLLAEHGEETCRSIVRFALAKAEETRFQIRYFGAILGYVSEAVSTLEQRREHEVRAARIREREERKRAGEEAAWRRLSPWERFEKSLEGRVALFRIKNRNRSPRPEELEELRRECAEREGIDLDGNTTAAAARAAHG